MSAPKLSDILTTDFGMQEDIIAEARRVGVEQDICLAEALIKKKVITELQLLKAYSRLYDLPFVSRLPTEDMETDFAKKVPIGFLKKHTIVPVILAEGNKSGLSPDFTAVLGEARAVIAINDPTSFPAADDLAKLINTDDFEADDFEIVLSTRESIYALINIAFDSSRDTAQQLVADMEENSGDILSEIEETADLLDDTSDAPIIKLVNHVISQSVKIGASDIHIEPEQHSFKIRYRVDGILYDMLTPPKWMQASLVSRIKVMAKMNIAEKRLPQDGRFEVKIGNQSIDIRVSTIPISDGERVVLRLLNKSGSLFELTQLGIEKERLDIIKELIQTSHGIVLVTGPTGSGKTTTLYAILSTINSPDINIITIEDPVEYKLKGVNQIQVNSKIDLTFARGLRSIVRQDPDVILIGEMRDLETAEIGVQSALTGHLVFSTLHTNDSASAITRLVDLGIEPFLISSSVLAVVAQRLVRVLCDECKQPYTPDDITLKRLGISPENAADIVIYRPQGCPKCFQSGYRGRLGIYEILRLDETIQSMVLKTHDSHQIKKQAIQQGMSTLYQDGISKVLKGITTIEEVLRVTQS
ncbi:MAG: type II secretion system ATPase GspE [Deltaproteobacteria bacterium]|nr:type II secretion system ATPase GspE [Deltaproteobacteria bacterium]